MHEYWPFPYKPSWVEKDSQECANVSVFQQLEKKIITFPFMTYKNIGGSNIEKRYSLFIKWETSVEKENSSPS